MAFHRNLKGLDLHNSKITQYEGNPNGVIYAYSAEEMCIDITNKVVYTSTAEGNGNWVIVGGSGDITTIDGLSDVNTTDREIGDILYWDGTQYKFEGNNLASAGTTNDTPTITYDSVNDLINISSSTVYLFDNANYQGPLVRYSIAADSLSYIADTLNYLVVSYNSGNPIYEITTNVDIINESDIIPVHTFIVKNGTIFNIDWDSLADGISNKIHMRLVKTDRFKHEAGLQLSEDIDQHVNITSGHVWYGAVRNDLSSFASNVGQWVFWYHSNGDWQYSTSTTTYNNTQYDDGTNLQTLANNKFVVNWIFRCSCLEDRASYLLSNQYDTLAEARLSQPPSDLPLGVGNISFLVGRIIVEANATSGETESAFVTHFETSTVTKHNDLSELDTGDYQHLTLTEHDNVTSNTPTYNYVNYSPYQWNDLRAPATAIKTGQTSPPAFDPTNIGYLFDDASTEEVFIIMQMDHSWAIGTNIVPHIHWTQTGVGDVVWELHYRWIGNGEIVEPWQTITTTTTLFTYNTGELGQISTFGELTPPASAGLSAIFKARVSRLGGDGADTYTGDALFNEFDIHYQIDYHGSEQDFAK